MHAQLFLVFIVLISFFSCATQEPQKTVSEEMIREYARKDMERHIKENGTRLYCDQTSYLQCFNISREQCLSELEGSRVKCFEQAWEILDDKKMSDENLEHFGVNHMRCLVDRHFSFHEGREDEILVCLSSFKEDTDQAMRSLFGE